MSQTYFTILTAAGAAAEANAKALGQTLQITQFAVGDGGGASYDPDVETLRASTELVNELYRGAVNELAVDPDNPARYYAEGVVPVAVGGWTVREAGWFLADGTLYAVTKYPPSYKSVPADGVSTELPVRTYLATGSTDTVTLKIDPTVVLATRDYVDGKVKRIEITDNKNAVLNRRHLFTAHADLQLINGKDDDWIMVKVANTVDLSAGKCRLLPPAGKKINIDGELFDDVEIKLSGVDFTLDIIDGVYTA
ncbi:phage tail protein [Shewanella sp.]|uniref:phage tail protein n=1 Tax=Shewanella sp. TaxID=50422 RepID=UPI003565B691